MKKALILLTAFLFLAGNVQETVAAPNTAKNKTSATQKKQTKRERTVKEKKPVKEKKARSSSSKQKTRSANASIEEAKAVPFTPAYVPERPQLTSFVQLKKESSGQEVEEPLPVRPEVTEESQEQNLQPAEEADNEENDEEEDNGPTPEERLFSAVKMRDLAAVRQAVTDGANLNARQNKVFVIQEAFQAGDETIVTYLLARGADAGPLDEEGRNLYYLAFTTINTPSVVKALLDKNLSVDFKDFKGTPVLFHAMDKSKNFDIVSMLVKDGHADLNITNSDGITPLIYAIREGYPDQYIDLFLTENTDLTIQNKYGNSALHFAVSKGNVYAAQKLLAAGADVNEKNKAGITPLMATVESKNPAMMKLIINKKFDMNVLDRKGNTVLMAFLKKFSLENEQVVAMLIDAGADVNIKDARGFSPLMYATILIDDKKMTEGDNVVEMLIAAGADLSERDKVGKTAMMHLMRSRFVSVLEDISLIQMMLDAGAPTEIEDFDGRTALILAAKETSSVPLINALLDAGADINHSDSSSKKALDYAKENVRLSVQEGYEGIIGRLNPDKQSMLKAFFKFLELGSFTQIQKFVLQKIPLEATDESGDTALIKAITYSRDLDIIRFLIDSGAKVDARNLMGDTPLMKAFIHNKTLEVVNLLLEKGADVNAQNKRGDTPLRRAVVFGADPRLIDVLLKAGASPDIQDVDGLTIWDYVEKHPEIKETETFRRLAEMTGRK